MTKEAFQKLLDKYFQGTVSQEEMALIKQFSDHFLEREVPAVFQSDADKEAVRQELLQRIQPLAAKRSRSAVWWRIAAGVLLVIGLGFAVWQTVFRLQEPQWIELAAGAGERSQVTLSDGTTILLNARSRLKYPEHFGEDFREVKLSGEAFFNVTHQAEKPFVVSSEGVQTRVLGTRFNVKAYPTESAIVSLLSGAVAVNAASSAQRIKPGEQAVFDRDDATLLVQSFDSVRVLAWQDYSLWFDRSSFEDARQQIKQQYGLSITFEDPAFATYSISGHFDKMPIDTLLQAITITKDLQYRYLNDSTVLFYQP